MTAHLVRLTAVLLAVGLFCSTAQAKAPEKDGKSIQHKAVAGLPQWKPDAKLLPQLQPERQFGPFRMRVPIGFTIEQHELRSTNRDHVIQYTVTGHPRTDNSLLIMFMTIGIAVPGYKLGSVESLLNGNSELNGQPGLTKSAILTGEVNGIKLSCRLCRYPADMGGAHLTQMQVLQYATVEGKTFLIISALDEGPHAAEGLPLAEAAALTLRRIN